MTTRFAQLVADATDHNGAVDRKKLYDSLLLAPEDPAALIVDAGATVENVRRVFAETLSNADREDMVIISLSCHGSRDHRITLRDTELSRLVDTTIPMVEL